MSDYIVVDGRRQFAPGVITKADASSVGGRGPVSRGTIAILHEAGRGGEPAVPQLCSNPNYLRQLLPPREGKEHNPTLVDLVDIVNSHADKLNARLFTFMDYAAIGRK